MATLQAALKRGIEMTYQIEESELVAEALPTQDSRQAIMFYEAAEGGAGVLTRLATEPQALAQVAESALKLLHYNAPTGPWKFDELPVLEQLDKNGHHICEAGCYQCLLSYFNQPDHDNINRRNDDALKLLVAMANAQVLAAPQVTSALPTTLATSGETPAANTAKHWLATLQSGGFSMPTSLQASVTGTEVIADAIYKDARAVVFLSSVSDDVIRLIQDKGRSVIVMPDPAQWLAQFAAHPEIFGPGNQNNT
jgi:hypothetical protein